MSTEVSDSISPPIYQSGGEEGSVFIVQTEFLCKFQRDLTLTYLNPQCCRHFDKTMEELKGNSFLIFVLEEDRTAFRQKLSRLNLKYPDLIYECNIRSVSNESFWYQWITRAIFSKKGQLREYQSIGRTVANRRRSEVALLEVTRRYQAVVEDQTELVCRYLPDGTLLFANKAYCRYHNKEMEELKGKSILPNIHPDQREKLHDFIRTASPERSTSIQIQSLNTNKGESLWIEWRRHAFFDDSNNLREIQSVGRDITELKLAETALKFSEKALREKNIELERKNLALTEVLEQIEQQKRQIKDDVITNVDDLLIPILEPLMSKSSKLDMKYLNLLKRSLQDLASSFGRKITHKSLKLSPREVQICNIIRRGLSSKEIANLLNISLNTVGRHRHSIRKKAKIIEKNDNLYNYLQSL
jgi:PAS domain S-box-containing protein